MKTYFIEPGDWESATGECLPAGSEGIAVVTLENYERLEISLKTSIRHEDETTDYRRGFVEGQAGERNVYLLCMGGINLDEYNRGFRDGLATQEEECDESK